MAAQIQSNVQNTSFVRRALQADGLFCTASGAFSVLASAPITTLFGLPTTLPIMLLGVGLFVYGIALFALATYRPVDRRFAQTILALNIAWLVGSAFVLITGVPALTDAGKWAVLIVADIVAVLAALQYVGLRRMS